MISYTEQLQNIIKELERDTDRANRAYFQDSLCKLYGIDYLSAIAIYEKLEQESFAELG